MERESFENPVIAELLNRDYICVKVDREERPDVDAVYMSVCQAMNGQGGWPLTVIMTPECRPFFSGTYFPPRARYGRMGLEELLTAVAVRWKENREELSGSAERIEAYLKEQEQITRAGEPGMVVVHRAFRQFARSFDAKNGGFGGAPKFPTPHNLMFLMEYGVREKNRDALAMAEHTLAQMYRGGIFDHIGGGFSRYSTDEKWMVPHFEKMLYDNALLVMAYAEAFAMTGRKMYGFVVKKILGYVERELTDEQGGFYCGQDADSDGIEGKYYVFTREEIKKVLGKKDGDSFCIRYGITRDGNFEGKSIPNLLENEKYELSGETEDGKKLYEYRIGRTSLHKDDKILVSWNGLMICACAKAGAVLGEKRYVEMAVRAETFILKHLVRDGRLLVRYRDGDAAGEGKLDDYAFFILGLVELYKVTFRTEYLSRAAAWAKTMLEQFFDWENGGFYLYAKDGEKLIVRTKETYDGAIPSGNSVAAGVLQQLAQITGETNWQEALNKQLRFLAGAMEEYPSGNSFALLTMMNVLYPARELICTLSNRLDSENKEKLSAQLVCLTETSPGLSVVVKTEENERELKRLAPYTGDYPLPEDGARFYLCAGSKCMPPVSELSELLAELEGGRTV
ncbi:thioredoxin domain-containing protein [Clostridium transplantifaecale]|uniref:thioredoxin domain-containing protein n=1 Tax=Clostridium transplantifaecale TaxID=2479838 RepID=UPI000F644EFE|nr:thioredoxin domain-containing protein [Clostridium transplantifaecale]